MKKTLLLLLLPALFITGCSDNDQINTVGLENQWNLVEISNPFTGSSQTFERGAIVWAFDEPNREVTIVNNNGGEDTFFASGKYGYTIGAETQVCNDALYVEQTALGCLTITGDTLVVTKEYADGKRLTFAR